MLPFLQIDGIVACPIHMRTKGLKQLQMQYKRLDNVWYEV